MKKLLLILVFCSIILNIHSQTTFYVDISGKSEITCGDSAQLVADLVTPVTINLVSAGYDDDGIGLQIIEKNSHALIVEDLYIRVKMYATVDTTLFLKSGDYILLWVYGGANLGNPQITGNDGSWTIVDNRVQLEFNVDTLVDSRNVTFNWPNQGSDENSITIGPDRANTYKVIATLPDGSTAEDSIMVVVNPLTATVEHKTVSCGNTAQLNVTTNYTGTGALSYNWTPSPGLSAADIPDPVATVISATSYAVEIETPNGCTASDTATVSTSVISLEPSICYVTVNENDNNVIIWKSEQNAAVDSFFIYRESQDQTGRYDKIGMLPFDASGIFIDTTSNARVQSNQYKIAVKDICGFTTDKSPEHKTMHLTINRGIGNDWNLIWEQYVGVPVTSYRIYRGTTKANLELIGTSSGSNTTYTDETAPAGDVYYQIEVILPVDCSLLKAASNSSSRSNIFNSAAVTTGIADKSVPELELYPNPTKDKLYIKNDHAEKSTVLIYDMQGNLVSRHKTGTGPIDISHIAKGMYAVKLVNSGGVFTGKMVKE